MKKQFALLLCFSLSVGLAACSSNPNGQKAVGEDTSPPKVEDSTNHKGSIGDEQEVPNTNDQTKTDDTNISQVNPADAKTDEPSIDAEQKKMAIDALKGLVENAKEGRVFRLTDGFYVGKTSRKQIHDTIGKPESSDSYDHYSGSMGQASYDLAFDSKGILKEARYYGTNVERQTNLGGITVDDLVKQVGKPIEKRAIAETGEVNYIYRFMPYEVQFVFGKDDALHHVNLLMGK